MYRSQSDNHNHRWILIKGPCMWSFDVSLFPLDKQSNYRSLESQWLSSDVTVITLSCTQLASFIYCCRTWPFWVTEDLKANQSVNNDVIMSAMGSQITSLNIVYSTVWSGADQRKHQSSASLAFVRGIHRWAVDFPHKGPETRKIFPFDDVIMCTQMISSHFSSLPYYHPSRSFHLAHWTIAHSPAMSYCA